MKLIVNHVIVKCVRVDCEFFIRNKTWISHSSALWITALLTQTSPSRITTRRTQKMYKFHTDAWKVLVFCVCILFNCQCIFLCTISLWKLFSTVIHSLTTLRCEDGSNECGGGQDNVRQPCMGCLEVTLFLFTSRWWFTPRLGRLPSDGSRRRCQRTPTPHPPTGPNSFVFTTFLLKSIRVGCWRPPMGNPGSTTSPCSEVKREISKPPLTHKYVSSRWKIKCKNFNSQYGSII